MQFNRIVFVDTSEVVRLGFRFDRPPLSTFVERKKRGQAFLLLPTVIAAEWVDRAERHVESALSHINQARRAAQSLSYLDLPELEQFSSSVDESKVKQAVRTAVENWIATVSVPPPIASLKPYDSDEVLRWYFAGKPPFTDKKEKNQFPDAFAVSALTEWARRNPVQLRVVTSDAAMADAFRQNGGHAVYDSLDAVLTEISQELDPQYDDAMNRFLESTEEVTNHIASVISRLKFSTIAPYQIAIDRINELNVSAEPTFVQKAGSFSAFASFSVTATMSLRCTATRIADSSHPPSLLDLRDTPHCVTGSVSASFKFIVQSQFNDQRPGLAVMSAYPEISEPLYLPLPARDD